MRLALLLATIATLVMLPMQWLPIALLAAGAAAVPATRATRRYLVRFATATFVLAAFFYAAIGPHPTTVRLGPLPLSGRDFQLGLAGAARLVCVFAAFTLSQRFVPARDLLPYTTRGGIAAYAAGALLRLVPTLRADAERLREAQAVRGHRFRPGLRGAATWRPLLVPLFVATLRRAREQAMAVHLAGLTRDAPGAAPGRRAHQVALIVSLAALAAAGRLILLAVPGVSFSFFVLLIAGVAYGPRVGFLVGLLERLATDLAISGLNPVFLPMAPVDAALGAGAGFLGRAVNFGQRAREPYAYAVVLAGTAGWAMTAAFSVGADTSTWVFHRWLLPAMDADASTVLWTTYVVRGLLFNVPSMIFNAALFGTATYPILRGLRASGVLPESRSLTAGTHDTIHA